MDLFRRILFFCLCFFPTLTFANRSIVNQNPYSVGLELGTIKPTNLGNSTSFPIGFSTFSYGSNTNDSHATFFGVSANKIFTLAPRYSAQIGASYHYISNMNVEGNLLQGVSTPYYQANYSYTVNSSQYLIDTKLRQEFRRNLFPYLYLGLGVASNSAFNYETTVPAYLTVTPTYKNKTTYAFSYSAGAGIEYVIQSKLSIGLGYRFINLGGMGLGSGTIRNTAVKAALSQSNVYLNSLLAQLNYYI